MGRPSSFTPEIVKEIVQRLSDGEPMRQICRSEGMPDASTVWDWCQNRPEVSQAIAHARNLGEDAIAEDCFEIADDARNDWMESLGEEGKPIGYRLNGDHVQRSKLRIETRLKLLAKWNPKKYGDRIQQEVNNLHTLEDVPDNVLERLIAEAERRQKESN